MTFCVTVAHDYESELIKNHKYYAKSFGYDHQQFDVGSITNLRALTRWKFSLLYQHLLLVGEDELVVLVDSSAAFVKEVSLEALMIGRDFLVADTAQTGELAALVNEAGEFVNTVFPVQTNFIVARNTAQIRNQLMQYINFLKECAFKHNQTNIDETAMLRDLGWALPQDEAINGYYIGLSIGTNWDTIPCFLLNIGDSPIHANYIDIRNIVQHKHLSKPILQSINRMFIDKVTLFQYDSYPKLSTSDFDKYNNGKIAFVMLYTPNIASYANVAEHNFKRYCDQHNYSFYVYRDLPEAFKDKNISGSWLKHWLLKQSIMDHEWIFWVDADILVLNPDKPIEELLEGRDLLFANDIAAWDINSGVMGFKNTEENMSLLQEMCDQIDGLEDKSGVYSNQGDQYHIIQVLKRNNCLSEKSVVDYLTINTPPAFKNEATFMVHYAGEPSPIREIHMLHDDRKLLEKSRLKYRVANDFAHTRYVSIQP